MRTCVLTDSLTTCYYLAAEIEGRGISYQLLHSVMDAEEQLNSLRRFLASTGIFVATRAPMISGIDFSKATNLVLYDIPGRSGIDQLLGRFDRIGRQTQLSVRVFVPSADDDATDSPELEILRQAITTRAGDHPEFRALLSE